VTMNEPGLIAEQLFDEPNVVAAGAESPWAKKRRLAPDLGNRDQSRGNADNKAQSGCEYQGAHNEQ
jgi:DNA-binding transcriptional LysR family regulator